MSTALFNTLALTSFVGATVLTSIISPPFLSGAEISNDFLTQLTPLALMIASFWSIIIFGQIGLMGILFFGSEGNKTFINSIIGFKLIGINVLMTAWTFAWSLKAFVLSEVALVGAFVCTVGIVKKIDSNEQQKLNGTGNDMEKKVWFCLELPVKMIFGILISLDLWQNLLLSLDYYKYIGSRSGQPIGNGLGNELMVLILLAGLSLMNGVIIFRRNDVLYTVVSVYLTFCLLLHANGKSNNILVLLYIAVCTPVISLIGARLYNKSQFQNVRLNSPSRLNE